MSDVNTAAVIDIGSNTIKMMVAKKTDNGFDVLDQSTFETRISKGISKDNPELTEESMMHAKSAIVALYNLLSTHKPDSFRIVATSAVRDAKNGNVFVNQIHKAIGHRIEIISGDEEARLIAAGIMSDPALKDKKNLFMCDMGGGSVECIRVSENTTQTTSLPLGCVRVMESHVTHPELPLTEEEIESIRSTVTQTLDDIPFLKNISEDFQGIGTGGTFTSSRAILAALDGKELEASSPTISMVEMEAVFEKASKLHLNERLKIPKLPANRADVFPTALLTLITIGKYTGITQFYHSFYNLRYGAVAEMLNN